MTDLENQSRDTSRVKPIVIKGTYNEALVYARAVEMNCEDQILQYLNHEAFHDTRVRIMPDVHLGKGTVVGFTATCNSYVVPSLIGVDIGCGVSAYNLGPGKLPFEKLDRFIRREIPSGMAVHTEMHEKIESSYGMIRDGTFPGFGDFKQRIRSVCGRTNQNIQRVLSALGSLGGGNHFIEIDLDELKNRWLLIHSGSRNFGLKVARHHEAIAVKETDPRSGIKFLSGSKAGDYLEDMASAQMYAGLNRLLMVHIIVEGFFKEKPDYAKYIESIHNYIDFDDRIVRKGAIAAGENQPVVIPFSMAEGAVIGLGRGNAEWNYSAPHGSGRKISRGQALQGLSMDEYRRQMKGVWSTSVSEKTLDESPMAYKRRKDILGFLSETVDITNHLSPVYNFKASD